MEQNNQFSDLSNTVEIELQNGSLFFLNQIKNYNTLDKKLLSIKSLNLKDEKEYQKIINGILNGMLYDENMSIENYFQFLYSINQDSFRTFLIKMADVISFSKLKKEKFKKIYQIFEKIIKINTDKSSLREIIILICRQFYPGQDLLNSIIYTDNINDNNNIDDFIQNNTFYSFLRFIYNNLQFIFENDKEVNLPGLIFIKILRLLTETHVYHQKFNLVSNENSNDKSSTVISNIVDTYQKINFSENIKKLINEIYNLQISILTKIYQEKKDNVLSSGRELIRHLISIGKSNIEIINTIINDLNPNYENILSLSNIINGYNLYTMINIPPLMERMLCYILTSIKKSSVTYSYYINWLFHEYKIESSIGNTLLVDITRFIITNHYYYMKFAYEEDYVPKWLILGYLLKHIKNHIISAEIKQTIFLDLILFDKTKDSYFVIEPCLSCIIINLKDFPAISEELIEYLEHYVKHFDNKNVQKRINSVCDAFHIFEQKDRNNNDFEKLVRNSKMEDKFKDSFINLIKNKVWLKENDTNNNNIYINNINIHNNNDININQKNDAINNTDQKMNIEIDIFKDNNSKNTNKSNINKNLDISKNINKINNPPKQEKNKENSKKINIEIMIPKELTAYVSVTILKNFATEKNQKRFSAFLNELCKYNSKIFGNLSSNVKLLDSSYKNLCISFAKFYIKIFKDELEVNIYENFDFNLKNITTYLYVYLFDYAFEKIGDNNTFSFVADLINQTIEVYPLLILHLISYVLINNFLPHKTKNNNDYINFFLLLNNMEPIPIKQKINLFFVQCEENFLNLPLKFFFSRGGVEIFNIFIVDDEHLILKLIRNCDLECINTINMSLINNKYILIDKKFFILYKYSILLSPLEKNIFWNIIFSQGIIPSTNLEQFLVDSITISKNPPTLKGELDPINYDEFFGNIIKSIKILFKNEIFTDINNGDTGLDSLCGKISHIFEFDLTKKGYIFILLENFFDFYFNNKLRKKMFSLIVQKFFAENKKNIDIMRIMIEFILFFIDECKRRYIGDKVDNTWICDDIKTIINEITKLINNFNNS